MKTKDKNNHYTTEKLGKTREKTPEGFLLCRDVAIARTGDMLYGAGEVPVDDDAGLIVIGRDADELFKPETIASFEGKAATNDHPDDWVTPQNWKTVAVGVTQNVRRGTGVEDHLLFADLLITDEQAIKDVEAGKREVSCGYDADYEQTGKGKGIQRNIIGNHVALVDKGRCGSRCSIGDRNTMAEKSKKLSFADRLRKAFMSKDTEAAEALAKEAETKDLDDDEDGKKVMDDDLEKEDGKTSDALKLILKKLGTMDTEIKALKKTRDSDPAKKTDDEGDDKDKPTEDDVLDAEKAEKKSEEGEDKYTGDSLQELRSRAAILSPTLRLPTLDAQSKDVSKMARACKCQALDAAYKTEHGKKAIDPFLAGRTADFAKLPAHTLDSVFAGASELLKAQNNSQGVRSGISTRDFGRPPQSPADINAANRQFWADRSTK